MIRQLHASFFFFFFFSPLRLTPSSIISTTSDGLSGGAVAGIVIGVLIGVALLGAAIWFLVLAPRRAREPDLLGGGDEDGYGRKSPAGTLRRDEHARAVVSGALAGLAEAEDSLSDSPPVDDDKQAPDDAKEDDQVAIARKLRLMAEAEQARSDKEAKSWGEALGGAGGGSSKKKKKKKKAGKHGFDDESDDDAGSDAGSSEQIKRLLRECADLSLDEAKDAIRESPLIDDILDKHAGSDDDSSEVLEKLVKDHKKANKRSSHKKGKKAKKERRAKEQAAWDGTEMEPVADAGALKRKQFAVAGPVASTRD